jgi:hypothetical protein
VCTSEQPVDEIYLSHVRQRSKLMESQEKRADTCRFRPDDAGPAPPMRLDSLERSSTAEIWAKPLPSIRAHARTGQVQALVAIVTSVNFQFSIRRPADDHSMIKDEGAKRQRIQVYDSQKSSTGLGLCVNEQA